MSAALVLTDELPAFLRFDATNELGSVSMNAPVIHRSGFPVPRAEHTGKRQPAAVFLGQPAGRASNAALIRRRALSQSAAAGCRSPKPVGEKSSRGATGPHQSHQPGMPLRKRNAMSQSRSISPRSMTSTGFSPPNCSLGTTNQAPSESESTTSLRASVSLNTSL